MSDPLIATLFIIFIVFGLTTMGLDLLGSSIYDLREISKQKLLKRSRHSRRLRYRPLVSIIIPAYNEEKVILRCLNSILKSRYRKYEIIIVDDASRDTTSMLVRNYIKDHPKKAIRLLRKRKNVGRGGAINAGVFRYAKGELIMALDADSLLQPETLRNAVDHFLLDDRLVALAANVRIMKQPSLIALLQRYEWLTSFRTKKINTVLNAEHIIGGSGAMYRTSIFKRVKGMDEFMWTEDIDMSLRIAALGNKEHRLYYGSNVIVLTEAVPTYAGLFKQRYRWKLGSLQALFARKKLLFNRQKIYTKSLSWYRLPAVIWSEILLLMEPFVYIYFIYLAILLRNPLLFLLGWIGITFMLAFAIWGDDQLRFKDKLQYSFYIPVMYALFYVLTLVQIVAIFRCFLNFSKITGKTKFRGNWIPPKRVASSSEAA